MDALKPRAKPGPKPGSKRSPNLTPKRRFKVRTVSRDSAFSRIKNLRCYQEIYDKILEGWPMPEVARFIQEDRGESLDITRGSLTGELVEYRSTIPPADLIKRRITPVIASAVTAVEEGIDELAELEKLYKLQMGRIDIDVQNERNIKKLLPTTGQEVRVAREILSTYADLKMDLGLSKRHLGQMDVEARLLSDVAVRYNKPEVQNVLANPQSRKKVLGLAERLMSRSAVALAQEEGDAVEAAPGPDPVEGNLLEEDNEDPLAAPIPSEEAP